MLLQLWPERRQVFESQGWGLHLLETEEVLVDNLGATLSECRSLIDEALLGQGRRGFLQELLFSELTVAFGGRLVHIFPGQRVELLRHWGWGSDEVGAVLLGDWGKEVRTGSG